MRSRQRIIDATLGVIERDGFAAVHVSTVATAAGVSRQTVYSIFGTKEDLVSQAVISVAGRALDEVKARLAAIEGAGEYAAELLVAARAVARRDPIFQALLQGGLGNPVFDEGMMARARPVAEAVLAPLRERSNALTDDAAFDDLVELFTRLGLSVLLFDSDRLEDDDDLRAFTRRWLQLD